MKSIDILVDEHNNIKKVLGVIRKACVQIVEDGEINHEDFFDMIDFIRNYADKYHHGKEEDMLFIDMSKELGNDIKNGPIQGMLIEHDLGRRYIGNLDIALTKHQGGDKDAKVDIIANAISYANLLAEHIHKEDNALYQFAIRRLTDKTKDKLNQEIEEFESLKEHQDTREKYIEMANRLQKKYQ